MLIWEWISNFTLKSIWPLALICHFPATPNTRFQHENVVGCGKSPDLLHSREMLYNSRISYLSWFNFPKQRHISKRLSNVNLHLYNISLLSTKYNKQLFKSYTQTKYMLLLPRRMWNFNAIYLITSPIMRLWVFRSADETCVCDIYKTSE